MSFTLYNAATCLIRPIFTDPRVTGLDRFYCIETKIRKKCILSRAHKTVFNIITLFLSMQPPEVRPVNLMEQRHLLPPTPLSHPLPALPDHLKDHCPNPSVFTSTMTTIPATSSMLSKMKLPLAIHIHPYKDGTPQVRH